MVLTKASRGLGPVCKCCKMPCCSGHDAHEGPCTSYPGKFSGVGGMAPAQGMTGHMTAAGVLSGA